MDDADMEMAMSAILFGAVGTTGQRCTSTRRIFLQKGIADKFTEKLTNTYKQVRIGDPLDSSTLMGPLVDSSARDSYVQAIETIEDEGGKILYGGNIIDGDGEIFGSRQTSGIGGGNRDSVTVLDLVVGTDPIFEFELTINYFKGLGISAG